MALMRKKVLCSPKREGQYFLFVQLKSHLGKQSLFKKNANLLFREDYASNLYMYMADDVLSRVIFHNPYLKDIQHIYFDLPTRTLPEAELAQRGEYKKQGYAFKIKNQDKLWKIADANNYREAIARELLLANRNDIVIEQLNVRPISYDSVKNKDLPQEMAFLYLADSICSILSYQYDEQKGPADWLAAFAQKLHSLNGSKQNLCFAYDSLDALFQQAWRYCENKQYFEALSLLFDMQHEKNKLVPFYQKHWFPCITTYIKEHMDANQMQLAIQKFQEYSYSNTVNQEKLYDIFQQLEELLPLDNQVQRDTFGATIFALYDAGVSAYNHVGQSEQAKTCLQKCKEFASYVDIETYLRTRNKYVVLLNDSFDFKKAKEEAESIYLDYSSDLDKLRKKVFGRDSANSSTYGRNLSQLGQAYAFLRDTGAEECFEDALKEFAAKSADYYITLSYLLHYYIDQNDKEHYDTWAAKYFGGEIEPQKQFEYLMHVGKEENPIISLKFGFFVFIKGLYKFHKKQLKDFHNDFWDVEKLFTKYHVEQELNGHPWELIYKYLAYFARMQSHPDIAEAYLRKMENVVQPSSPTIQAIVHNGKREFYLKFNEKEKAEQEKTKLVVLLQQMQVPIKDEKDIASKFCYMYD